MPEKVKMGIITFIVIPLTRLIDTCIISGQINSFSFLDIFTFIIQLFIIGSIIYNLLKGKNWARLIILCPFLIMTIVLPFRISSILKENIHNGLLLIVFYLVEGIALKLLYSKEGNEWFNSNK